MNKLLLLFLLCSFTVNAQKIDRKVYYDYSENVEFRVYSLTKQRIINRGPDHNGVAIVAEKGRRFVTLALQFKNNSSETQVIDFEEVFIRNQNGELHDIDFVVMGVKLTISTERYKQKIKPNKKRIIYVQFRPSFDKDEEIKTLIMDGKTITLKYK